MKILKNYRIELANFIPTLVFHLRYLRKREERKIFGHFLP